MSPSHPEAAARLLELIQMRLVSEAIYVAAALGLADLLTEPKTSKELAGLTGTCRSSLQRVLSALVEVGVFSHQPNGCFALAPLGELLKRDSADSLHSAAVFFGGEAGASTVQLLLECVRTGQSAAEKLAGGNWVRFVQSDPERAELFNSMMTAYSALHLSGVLEAYDFAPAERMIDVGGGHSKIIGEILKRNPGMRGVLFDLPHVLDGARKRIAAEGLANRCEIVSGDFFVSVPPGGDAYLLSRVIHDWNDEKAIAILTRIREAINPEGRLILLETMLRPDSGTIYPVLSDLNMLLRTGGCERTEAEYRELYRAAGFELTRVVTTGSPTGTIIIEGKPMIERERIVELGVPLSAAHKDAPAVFACNLKAINAAERPRYNELLTRIRKAMRDRTETSNGYAFKLDSKTITLPEAAEWIGMERLCCPFLTLQLSALGNQAHWTLTLTGPDGTKPLLEAEFPTPV